MENNYAKLVTVIVTLLVGIGVSAVVLFEIMGAPDSLADSVTDTITQDSDGNTFTRYDRDGATGSNLTGEKIKLSYNPSSITNITCWNVSGTEEVESYLTVSGTDYSLNGVYLYVLAGRASNFTQVNITYVPLSGVVGGDVRDMGSTVFELAPIIALVLVATVIIGIVVMMGNNRKFGGV